VEEQAVRFRQDSIAEETLSPDFPLPYIPWSELHDELHGQSVVELGYSTREEIREQRVENKEVEIHWRTCFGHDERFGGRLKSFVEYLASIVERGGKVVVVSRQSPRLHELWIEYQTAVDGQPSAVEFVEASLSEGFTLNLQSPISDSPVSNPPNLSLHLITDSEVFGWERPQPRVRQRLCCRDA
jgi:transcription-repair coupling factor (superfamily II helicase)